MLRTSGRLRHFSSAFGALATPGGDAEELLVSEGAFLRVTCT